MELFKTSLVKKSEAIHSTLTKMAESLKALNLEIAESRAKKYEEMKRLEQEAFDLTQMEAKNRTLSDNIYGLFREKN